MFYDQEVACLTKVGYRHILETCLERRFTPLEGGLLDHFLLYLFGFSKSKIESLGACPKPQRYAPSTLEESCKVIYELLDKKDLDYILRIRQNTSKNEASISGLRSCRTQYKLSGRSLIYGSHINHGVGRYRNMSASSCHDWVGRVPTCVEKRMIIHESLASYGVPEEITQCLSFLTPLAYLEQYECNIEISKSIRFSHVYTYVGHLMGDPAMVQSINRFSSSLHGVQHNTQYNLFAHDSLQENEFTLYDSFIHWGFGERQDTSVYPTRYDPLLGYNIGDISFIRSTYQHSNILICCTKPSMSSYHNVESLLRYIASSNLINRINLTVTVHPFGSNPTDSALIKLRSTCEKNGAKFSFGTSRELLLSQGLVIFDTPKASMVGMAACYSIPFVALANESNPSLRNKSTENSRLFWDSPESNALFIEPADAVSVISKAIARESNVGISLVEVLRSVFCSNLSLASLS